MVISPTYQLWRSDVPLLQLFISVLSSGAQKNSLYDHMYLCRVDPNTGIIRRPESRVGGVECWWGCGGTPAAS